MSIRRTTINLDQELAHEAREALGTTTVTAAIPSLWKRLFAASAWRDWLIGNTTVSASRRWLTCGRTKLNERAGSCRHQRLDCVAPLGRMHDSFTQRILDLQIATCAPVKLELLYSVSNLREFRRRRSQLMHSNKLRLAPRCGLVRSTYTSCLPPEAENTNGRSSMLISSSQLQPSSQACECCTTTLTLT